MRATILAALLMLCAGFTCDPYMMDDAGELEAFDSLAECVDACLSTDDHAVTMPMCLAACGAESEE